MIFSNWRKTISYILEHKIILALVVTAFTLTLMPIIFDGQYGCIGKNCGMIIGTNYRDGVWFLAVAAAAFKTFPFRMPVYSGAPLQGYHYLPNLLSYLLTFVGVPITISYYKLLPILYMISLSSLAIYLGKKIKNRPKFVAAFLFFTFFGIPLSFILSLYHLGHIDNTLVLISTFQATRILESIHVALSFLILLTVLIIIYDQKLNLKRRLLFGLLIFIVFGTKFYEGIIILFLLGVNEVFLLIDNKKVSSFLINNTIYAVAALLSIFVFYNPLGSANAGSIFIWSPFATVHHLIETSALFYSLNLVNARYFLYAHGWSPRLIAIELFSTFLYVIYYFGTRAIGFIYIIKQIVTKKITRFEIVLTTTIIFAIGISVLFIQRGDWFNPMQFAACAAFIINIFAAKFLFELLSEKNILLKITAVFIILITFPANLVNLAYLNNPARYVIPKGEVTALSFLKNLPDGVVLSPIYGADSPYIPAFTGKQIYIGFMNVVENAGIPSYKRREEEVRNVTDLDIDNIEVKYIYIPKTYEAYQILIDKCDVSKKYKQIFKNDKVIIFEKVI